MQKPKVNVRIFAFCSEDEQKVEDWITEFDYRMLHIESGGKGPLPALEEIKQMDYSLQQRSRITHNRARFIGGTPDVVEKRLNKLAGNYNSGEIMIAP